MTVFFTTVYPKETLNQYLLEEQSAGEPVGKIFSFAAEVSGKFLKVESWPEALFFNNIYLFSRTGS